MTFDEANELARALESDEGYVCRVLPDNSVACMVDLMFTKAIILGVSRDSWKRRFCFEDRALAEQRFSELQSGYDEPAGYVARRGQ